MSETELEVLKDIKKLLKKLVTATIGESNEKS